MGQGSGGLVTIQIGHLDVAQYKVEVVSAMQANVGQRFASVAGEVHGAPFLAQHLLQHHAVDGVVLGSEDAQAGQPLRVRGSRPGVSDLREGIQQSQGTLWLGCVDRRNRRQGACAGPRGTAGHHHKAATRVDHRLDRGCGQLFELLLMQQQHGWHVRGRGQRGEGLHPWFAGLQQVGQALHGDAPASQGSHLPQRAPVDGLCLSQGQGQGEGAALTERRSKGDAAAHHDRQALADGQAQPRAIGAAGFVDVQLFEGLEQAMAGFGRDADAGVPHSDVQRLFLSVEVDVHHAMVGELDGIGDQVQQDLRAAGEVSAEARGDVGCIADQQRQSLAVCLGGAHGQDVVEQQRHIDLAVLNGQGSRFDAGVVHDVVDEGEQVPPRGENLGEGMACLLELGVTVAKLGQSENGVEGGA